MNDLDLLPRGVRRKILFVRVSEEENAAIAGAAAELRLTVVDFARLSMREKIAAMKVKTPAPKRKKR